METEYKYGIFDGQWFIVRMFHVLKNNDELSVSGLVTSFFWTITKYLRTQHSCEKVILLFDKWPYHRDEIIGEYKGDRWYASEDDLTAVDENTELSEEEKKAEKERIQYEIECNKIKQEAKYTVIKDFGKFGMPTFMKTGYEADDFANIISWYINDNDKSDKKSFICSIDSDWTYLISPKVDYANPRTGKVITYDEMMAKKDIKDISLYQYKAFIDSTYGSHNNVLPSHNAEFDKISWQQGWDMIQQKNYSILEDEKLFHQNWKSFQIQDFPEYDKVQQMMYYLDKSGSISSPDEFEMYSMMNGLDCRSYHYGNFIKNLNKDLYNGN